MLVLVPGAHAIAALFAAASLTRSCAWLRNSASRRSALRSAATFFATGADSVACTPSSSVSRAAADGVPARAAPAGDNCSCVFSAVGTAALRFSSSSFCTSRKRGSEEDGAPPPAVADGARDGDGDGGGPPAGRGSALGTTAARGGGGKLAEQRGGLTSAWAGADRDLLRCRGHVAPARCSTARPHVTRAPCGRLRS